MIPLFHLLVGVFPLSSEKAQPVKLLLVSEFDVLRKSVRIFGCGDESEFDLFLSAFERFDLQFESVVFLLQRIYTLALFKLKLVVFGLFESDETVHCLAIVTFSRKWESQSAFLFHTRLQTRLA
jgi:hypothetical protein